MSNQPLNQIAVIIPVYNAHDTIQNTLHSVAMQRHIDFSVYLVVDGEEPNSYDYLKEFFDVNIFYMPTNSGPGVARQYGIDHSDEPFISFIDSDDTYLSSLALYYQHLPFTKEDKYAIVSCDFLQENKDHSVKLRENDMVWMHGKMYKRAFLEKYDIRFNETRANEDVGVNTQCQCFSNEEEQIYLSHDVTYMWQWRDDSTVRTDNSSYMYKESVAGYVTNKIYAFERVVMHKDVDEPIMYFMTGALVHLFKKYLSAMLKAPKQVKYIKNWSIKYYKTIFKKYVTQDYLDKAEKPILAYSGLKELSHYEEFIKWKKLLQGIK